ncbi:TlpA family protein disulfide reductase [Bartonella sp. A05]|uniref:TlpA family protein disulfide reductase n=1 Tax=Bartonella sp. A05 TaxID=2967261 RepID=UPI0022A98B90|nr:TlpA disulfide reductase family protein [Bartonella sp. A05]MCZ2203560.1 TlpA family protein disulfide reductase [Bartonella sp. A05]
MIPQISIGRKNKKALFFIASFIVIWSLHAATYRNNMEASFFSNLISNAQAQETNADKTQADKMMAIRQTAKGFFAHMRFADVPYNTNHLSFQDPQGKERKLAEFNGKPMLINLWAIWCAPCRVEMPELAQLKRDMGEKHFDVMAINVDKAASPEKIQKFLNEVQADNLVYYRDSTMNILREVRKQGLALGLPITLLIDKDGNLIASFNGAAPWANDDAKALIQAVIKEEQ